MSRRPSPSSTLSHRHMLAGLGAAGLGVAGLSACAAGTSGGTGGGASDGGGKEDSEIRSFGKGGTEFRILSMIASLPEEELNQFAEENECSVIVEEHSFDKLTAMLVAGSPPDLVRGQGGVDTAYLSLKKLAEPLGSYLKSSTVLTEDRLDPVNDLWRHDGTEQGVGELYGIAKDYSFDMDLWVNADLVGEAPDLSTPWTYGKVLEMAKASYKESGGRVESYGYGNNLELPNVQVMEAMMATTGTDLWNADFTAVDFSSEAGVATVDFIRQLWDANLSPNPLRPSSSDIYQMFGASRLGTFQSGFWTQAMWPEITEAEMEPLHMIPPPVLGDTQISPVLSATGYWIPAKAKNKDLSWKFMEFHLAGESATARAKSGWGIPIILDDQEVMPDQTVLNQRVLDCTAKDKELFEVRSSTPYAKVDALNLDLATAFEKGVKAGDDSATIAADAAGRINAQLERGQR